MKRSVTLLLIALLTIASLGAVPIGISLSTWTPSPSVGSGQGLHTAVGGFVGLGPRLELEAGAIIGLTPHIGQDLLGSVFLSYPFAGPLYHRDGEATLYYNGFIGLGFIGGWDGLHDRAVGSLALRVIPFTIGGSYYSRRERALAFTLLYDLFEESWGFAFGLLGFDIYL